ncbi:MAG: phosphoglycerate dehydrogenase [Clostridia bacterium]|nr:phosphoglycerate dehydrogenase [Clostridia bacterium]
MRVLVSDPVAEQGIDLLRQAGFTVEVKTRQSEDNLVATIGDFDALVVRSETKVTRRVIEAGRKLKIIARAGVGVDNIDVAAATECGILVVNAPEGNTIAATEHTLALMLALARNVPQANSLLKQGVWERKKFMGVELNGKTLGIVGLGKIGTQVAKRARAFGMRVVAYDPYVAEETARHLGVELVDFPKVLAEADFLTFHLPLSKDTYHLIGPREFDLMRPGVRVLNVARGGIVDENALYEAIKQGKVAGAAIDVFEEEPLRESPLLELEQVVATPHLGASTAEAQVNVAVDVAQDIIRCLRGEPVLNAVNIPAVPQEALAALAPYFVLLERLGKFAAQVISGRVEEITIRYNGSIAQYDLTPLTNTFLKGFLRPVLGDAVNYVNAPVVARKRGIRLTESKTAEMVNFANLVSMELATDAGPVSLAGTLLQDQQPRVVSFNGYRVDAIPEGHILVIPHLDKPRIIGPVGTLIGAEDVNIAGMQVGRKAVGGEAVMFLNIDAPVSPATLAKIKEIDGVLDVKYVQI